MREKNITDLSSNRAGVIDEDMVNVDLSKKADVSVTYLCRIISSLNQTSCSIHSFWLMIRSNTCDLYKYLIMRYYLELQCLQNVMV